MKKHKYTFPEPRCSDCPDYKPVGSEFNPTRYCDGFKRKRLRRFMSSDPYTKPPRWCPRRLSHPICRIYGFADECSRFMDRVIRDNFHLTDQYIYPPEHHYVLRKEMAFGMDAKQFFQAVRDKPLEDVLTESDLEPGEVIEIDDGLQPYYFYYYSVCWVIPVPSFQKFKTKRRTDKEDR